MQPKFELGRVVSTPIVAEEVPREQLGACLQRHVCGDWGDVPAEDAQLNERALTEGTRLLSSYETASGHRIWIITEADRSSTTVLFPDEY